MTAHYDARETREPAVREAELFARVPEVLRSAMAAPAYAERLKVAGVATRYICADGMVHGFLQMRGIVPEAQTATEEIARALNGAP